MMQPFLCWQTRTIQDALYSMLMAQRISRCPACSWFQTPGILFSLRPWMRRAKHTTRWLHTAASTRPAVQIQQSWGRGVRWHARQHGCYGRTDNHDETNSRFSQFCERALKKKEAKSYSRNFPCWCFVVSVFLPNDSIIKQRFFLAVRTSFKTTWIITVLALNSIESWCNFRKF
jgi:hypothetical protein